MCTIAVNALYTTLYKRGTTRQLAGAIIICVVAALLLLPAIIWYNLRFMVKQDLLSVAEITVMLAYVALCGWMLPLGVTCSYCFFSQSRMSTTGRIPRQKRHTHAAIPPLPRYQSGVLAPFVFSEELPWGWLVYQSGNFQGQRLALKRAVAMIGRDENSDIWIDDDMASRHHAEIAWEQGQAYVTDCNSLNGVLLNGRRIRGSVAIQSNDRLSVGSQLFTFILANRNEIQAHQTDPLANHKWRSSDSLNEQPDGGTFDTQTVEPRQWQEAARLGDDTPLPQHSSSAARLIVRSGDLVGQSFALELPIVILGRGNESDLVINDASISRRHVQFLQRADGDYVQDLAGRDGTLVNDEPLRAQRLLKAGDIVCIGNILLEYAPRQITRTTLFPTSITSPTTAHNHSGPTLLKLPSKPKVQ